MKKEIRLLEDDEYDLNDELPTELDIDAKIGRASCRERVSSPV